MSNYDVTCYSTQVKRNNYIETNRKNRDVRYYLDRKKARDRIDTNNVIQREKTRETETERNRIIADFSGCKRSQRGTERV